MTRESEIFINIKIDIQEPLIIIKTQGYSYTKGLKRKHSVELSALESELSELEKTYQRGPTKDIYIGFW